MNKERANRKMERPQKLQKNKYRASNLAVKP